MEQTKPTPTKTYLIKDWTEKTCFGGVTFPTFEDAWEYIYQNDPAPSEHAADSGWFDDYYVVEVETDD